MKNSHLDIKIARSALQQHAGNIAANPQTNSVFDLARSFFFQQEKGDLRSEDMVALVNEVHAVLIERRADRFRAQHRLDDDLPFWRDVEIQLEQAASQGVDHFREQVERHRGGIVFTAHPTFALPSDLRAAIANLVEQPTQETREGVESAVKADGRQWSQNISLQIEHDEAQQAIARAQSAMMRYARLVFDIASRCFPDDWRSIHPSLPTISSWVGYDLDGRSDIHWTQSIALRLQEKAAQIDRYAAQLRDISGQYPGVEDLTQLTERLSRAATYTQQVASHFSDHQVEIDDLVKAANALTEENGDKIVHIADILRDLDGIIATADDQVAKPLCIVRAYMRALGLGTARIHLRVNAAQIGSVIRRDLGLETGDERLGRLALRELADKTKDAIPETITFADLFVERSTARRQFMMCAQILKHIDGDAPIRFLIAESENPSTVMGALYLARLYGVDHALDISPLFETPDALETGGRFIERLLDEPEFLTYVRERGYLSVQLGFSDAGRFIGQVAADMAIERIHNLIAQALGAKDPTLGLLIFNTHGESIGRGAWPGSFEDRFNHVLTPWTRTRVRQRDLDLVHEVSFQGGDGYLHFATEGIAEATYAAFSRDLLTSAAPETDDPFYTDTNFVWDFYRSLRSWHERLFQDPDYGHLLGDFAPNLLVKAGSRPQRRSNGPGGPRSLRAISHNATLQQVGVLANTASGIGSSLHREQERLIALIDASPRMRSLILLALKARMLTSVPALRAYASVYDPSFWVAATRQAPDEQAAGYRRVYDGLKDGETCSALNRIANLLSVDLGKFDDLLEEIDAAPSAEERHEGRLDLHILHAVRLSLMMRALSLVGRLPVLSYQHDVSADDLMDMVKAMRIDEAVTVLKEIFPLSQSLASELKGLSEARPAGPDLESHGYENIHKDIIEPLDQIDRLLHGITLALSHAYNAYG